MENSEVISNGPTKKKPKYELVYFNFRARAELSRLIFVVAGVEFKDTRIRPEDWLQLKPTTPCGQLPVLWVDGTTQISQSHAIARYLAREFGLAGKTSLDQAKADMIVDSVIDMMAPIHPCFSEKDVNKKNEMRRNYEEQLPSFIEKLQNLLQQNNDGKGYFVGDEMTWADIAVMNAWHWIPGFGVFLPLHQYPALHEHRERVESHPNITKWLEQRPQTPV